MNSTVKYKTITDLFKIFRKKQFVLFIICSLDVIFGLYFVYQLQEFVDIISSKENIEIVYHFLLKVIAIGIISFIIGLFQMRTWHTFRFECMNFLKVKMYKKILGKNITFFDEHKTGDIVSSVMHDGELIANMSGVNVLMLYINFLRIFIVLLVLLSENILLGLLVSFMSIVYFLLIKKINKHMRSISIEYSEKTADINQRLTEDINAIHDIKALNNTKYFAYTFENTTIHNFMKAARKYINIIVSNFAVENFASSIMPIIVVFISGIFYYNGELTIGSLILFYTYVQNLVEPLKNLSDLSLGMHQAIGAAERIYPYLFDEEDNNSYIKNPKLDYNKGVQINIESFGYDKEILHDVNFDANAGDIVYIQGESGSGKTTLIKLLCGFYKAQKGQVSVYGNNIAEYSESDKFNFMKIQFQQPIVLATSIRDNITLGDKFSDYEIMHVLEDMQMKDFVEEHGLDYILSEGGKNISGGQKQRLSLARVMIRKPKILILDEATNALDDDCEKKILEIIKNYIKENNCILFITSHGKNSQCICNKILSLNAE